MGRKKGDGGLGQAVLQIEGLRVSFRIRDDYYAAVDGVNLAVHRNEVLAIVGESGCGKSALALSIMGLHEPGNTRLEGSALFEGADLLAMDRRELNRFRGRKIGMIFQDPLSALNPLMTAGRQIGEALDCHTTLTSSQQKRRVLELLRMVGVEEAEAIFGRYPHELSGGLRQRVMIAIAIACEPALIIADEPTTALDVTIQAQIMDLLKELQRKTGAGVLLITHDMGIVAEMADRVAVMYAGELVELADATTLFERPLHPYTRSLLKSIPSLQAPDDQLHVIRGVVPPLHLLPTSGCRFQSRIEWIPASAHEDQPRLQEVEPDHWVRCTCYRDFHF
jgi:peptide/nickel transport system ATP-binding protein